MAIVSILGIIVFLLLIVGGYISIKFGKVPELLIIISGIAGFVCGILGFNRLTDQFDKNDVSGSILLVIGILVVFAVGVSTKILFSGSRSSNCEKKY